MTKRFIAGITAAGVLSGSALAADLPSKAPPAAPAPSYYDWSGPYVGADFGGAWTNGV